MTVLYEILATAAMLSTFGYMAHRFAKAELAKLHEKLNEALVKKEHAKGFTRG